MKFKVRVNKLVSVLLAIAVMLGLFAAMPLTAHAATAADLVNQIKNFDPGPGSTGKLDAFIITGRGIVVGGTVTDATKRLELDLDNNVRIIWSADYSGSLSSDMIRLTGEGWFEVASGGSIKNNGGSCIYYTGEGGAITVSGGTVMADHTAVCSYGKNSTINVSGGTVMGSKGQAIFLQPSSGNAGAINVSGGTVSSLGSNAIIATKVPVKVSGGFVFAPKSQLTGDNPVIYAYNGATATISGTAVVCGWNKASGTMTYTEGKTDNLTVNSGATATWEKSGTQSGINYKKGANEGFFAVSGVTVNAATPTETPTTPPTSTPTPTATATSTPTTAPTSTPTPPASSTPAPDEVTPPPGEVTSEPDDITPAPSDSPEITTGNTVGENSDGISWMWILFIGLAVVAVGGLVTVIIIVQDKKQRSGQSAMAVCENCGAQVQAGTKFCPECGRQIGGAPVQQPHDNKEE